ncbi:MAG: ribosome silencing factor [Acidobacteriota bacterium]|nr:ribosome silencing factor [Acidobacteriota bacterium]
MSALTPGATATPPPARELADSIAAAAADRKASDIVDIDLSGVAGFTDRFVICTGNTERQTKAIHDAVLAGVKEALGVTPRRVEGLPQAQWILMDYLDVIVHIFTPATREYYRLESLWGEAPVRRLEQDGSEVEDRVGAQSAGR